VGERPRIAAWLRERGASEDLASYAEAFGDDLVAFWQRCPRADWLLALAARAGHPSADLARAAQAVVRLGIDLLPEEDEARRGLEDGLEGAEPSQLAERLEAQAAHTPDGATSTLYLAIACALRAGTLPEAASLAAALTTQALVLDAGDCAMLSVVGWSQREGAERVRAVLDVPRLG
jgi:hypothetical protein